ncbi:MAG: class C sortase [Porcipelethomonas sp.]
MKIKKSQISTIILVMVFFVGLSVMLYPTVSDFLNSRAQKQSISDYNETINEMKNPEREKMLADAKEYNAELSRRSDIVGSRLELEGYDQLLDVTGTGIMGYITIPKLGTELPIYHGTSDEVLNIAVGHIQGTSLPVGGEDTHTVISAHRGLPSAKLFSDLDELEIGDIFEITVLDEVLTYSVEEIFVVEPEDFSKLEIVKGRDLATLVTCTPYGINTHRLLIRGTRVYEDDKPSVRVMADAVQVEPMLIAPLIAAPAFVGVLVYFAVGGLRKRRRKKNGGDGIER